MVLILVLLLKAYFSSRISYCIAVEELTCLATWKDGNSRYLVGLVSHHHAISNEERYRCFVYEKISSLMGKKSPCKQLEHCVWAFITHTGGPSMLSSKDAEYKLAQSGDATCNGLDSAEVSIETVAQRPQHKEQPQLSTLFLLFNFYSPTPTPTPRPNH